MAAFRGEAVLTGLATLETSPVKVSSVEFPPDAVTHWHSHEGGQLLYVISGAGRYQERGKAVRPLRDGDVVVAAPGVEHWHGAAPERALSHVAVSSGETTWGEAPDTTEAVTG
jgi:4-carboxymuconolactone decarboxylase